MSYSNLAAQASMVFDEVRNRAYLAAMRAYFDGIAKEFSA